MAKLKNLKADKAFFGRFIKKLTKENESQSPGAKNVNFTGFSDEISEEGGLNGVNGVVNSKAWGGLGVLCERMQDMTLDNLETVFAEVNGLDLKNEN